VNLRIGAVVISVNLIFLAAAFAFFVRLSYQRLHPAVFIRKSQAAAALAVVSTVGIAGAWLYGLLGQGSPVESLMPPSRTEFPFGSFGGYWGVILGSLLVSLLLRAPHLRQADALVPGILVSGAIARLAGLFDNANPGITIHLEAIPWFQPFRLWAAYDIAAHVAVLLLVWRVCRRPGSPPGQALALFLAGYGLTRLVLEFVRDTHHVLGPFTHGHGMAAVQMVAGSVLLVWIHGSRTEEHPHGPGNGTAA
jgi:prolipoprotein diacylglyceryltransferase